MTSLYKLGDDVYWTRKVRSHWDLMDVVEAKPNIEGCSASPADIEGAESNLIHATPIATTIWHDHLYTVGMLIAVRSPTGPVVAPFRIAEVVDIHGGKQNRSVKRTVLCHGQYGSLDPFTGNYRPSEVIVKRKRGRKQPCTGTGDVHPFFCPSPHLQRRRRSLEIFRRPQHSARKSINIS